MYNRVLKAPVLVLLALIAGFCTTGLAQETGGVKGKVRTSGGNGISNATISARKDGRDVKVVTSDNNGNFVMDGLVAGRYNVLFDAKGYSSGVLYNVEVKKKRVSDLGDRLMLSIDRGTLVIIQGSVFYKEGTSATGAKVECEEILSDGSAKKIGTAYTSGDGEFTFRRPEGSAKIRITATLKGVAAIKEVEVDQAAIYRMAISLDLSRANK